MQEPHLPRPADRKGFSILVRQHHRELLVYARALSADADAAQDIVQEAFVTAYQMLRTFDTSRDFGAWVRGIVRFKAREHFRRQKTSVQVLSDEALEVIESHVEDWEAARRVGTGSLFEALERCLEKLPERLRQAVDAFYFGDQSGDEAAASLAVPAPAFRKRLQRARSQLHSCISHSTTTSSHA